MDDYISREAVLDKAECDGNYRLVVPVEVIKNFPAADVEPVRHGKWENKSGGFWEVAACSVCGARTPTVGITPNYCPSCGAKMEGGADG